MREVLIFLNKGALPLPMQLAFPLQGSGGFVYFWTNVLTGVSDTLPVGPFIGNLHDRISNE